MNINGNGYFKGKDWTSLCIFSHYGGGWRGWEGDHGLYGGPLWDSMSHISGVISPQQYNPRRLQYASTHLSGQFTAMEGNPTLIASDDIEFKGIPPFDNDRRMVESEWNGLESDLALNLWI